MRTVQITLDEDLLEAVDQLVKELKTTRSAFTRDALKEAIMRVREEQLERKQIQGYVTQPVKAGEFDWEEEQVWGGF